MCPLVLKPNQWSSSFLEVTEMAVVLLPEMFIGWFSKIAVLRLSEMVVVRLKIAVRLLVESSQISIWNVYDIVLFRRDSMGWVLPPMIEFWSTPGILRCVFVNLPVMWVALPSLVTSTEVTVQLLKSEKCREKTLNTLSSFFSFFFVVQAPVSPFLLRVRSFIFYIVWVRIIVF